MALNNKDAARCATAPGSEMFLLGGWNNSQDTPSPTKRQRFFAHRWTSSEPLSTHNLSHLPPYSGEPDTFLPLGQAVCAVLTRLVASDHVNFGSNA